MKYTMKQWGWVYRNNGRHWGIIGEIGALDYQDVCDQIVNAARRDAEVTIYDENGNLVSVGYFKLN